MIQSAISDNGSGSGMSPKKISTGEILAQCIGVFGVVAVLLSIWPSWGWIATFAGKDAAPAWIQAVGSVAAIAGGVWTTKHQLSMARRHAADAQLIRRLQMAKVAEQIGTSAHRNVRTTFRAFEKWDRYGKFIAALPARLNQSRDGLDLIIAKDIDGDLLQLLVSMRNQVGIAQRCIELRQTDEITDQLIAEEDIKRARRNIAIARFKVRQLRMITDRDVRRKAALQ